MYVLTGLDRIDNKNDITSIQRRSLQFFVRGLGILLLCIERVEMYSVVGWFLYHIGIFPFVHSRFIFPSWRMSKDGVEWYWIRPQRRLHAWNFSSLVYERIMWYRYFPLVCYVSFLYVFVLLEMRFEVEDAASENNLLHSIQSACLGYNVVENNWATEINSYLCTKC